MKKKKVHWHVCDYTNFWETRSLGWGVSAVVEIFSKLFHIALILNSGAYWELRQFQMEQSLTSRESQNNHKPIWILHIALPVIIRDMHQWLHGRRVVHNNVNNNGAPEDQSLMHMTVNNFAGEETPLSFWMQRSWRWLFGYKFPQLRPLSPLPMPPFSYQIIG